jgi:F-type H+-transporting ATPase subunit b
MAASTTKTGTQADGGPKGTFPPFAGEHIPAQLLWLAIAFVLLYFLLARVVLPRLGAILAERQTTRAADLEEAGRLKGQSEAAIAAYEKALADARARAQQTVAEHQQKLAAQNDARRKALEAALAEKLAQAERSIEATRSAAMREVRGIAVEAAGAIVERLAGVAPARPAVERAVDSALH